MRKSLTVYCSGAPNFFIYGITKDMDTYCLINNQYWVRGSIDFEPEQLLNMIVVGKQIFNTQE